jgi:hypothetical protein
VGSLDAIFAGSLDHVGTVANRAGQVVSATVQTWAGQDAVIHTQSSVTGVISMNLNVVLGILLLVAAGVLLYLGYTASQGLGEQIHETFTGRFTDSTTWYFVFGVVAAIAGVVMLTARNWA